MMTHRDALDVLAAHRREQVVVTTMGSVALWPQLSDSSLDFHYLPSSMGQGVPVGLGLCLAQPGRGVVVLTGDGGLLMNLGCLVTAAQFTVPLYILLIDNGLYEVTGGQVVANALGAKRLVRDHAVRALREGATRCEARPRRVALPR